MGWDKSMVKITGTEQEVQIIVDMLYETEYGACTYQTRDMKDDQFGVERCEDGKHLDFLVEFECIDKS